MVSYSVTLQQGTGIVMAGPGHLGPVAGLAAERQGVLEMRQGLVQVTHGLGQESQHAVIRCMRISASG